MATLTITQIDPRTHARLKARAAEHGRSIEDEARSILDSSVDPPRENILMALRRSMQEVGGVELDLSRE